MRLSFLPYLVVFISAVVGSTLSSVDDGDEKNRLEARCNQNIPQERSVGLGGECRSSWNCVQADAFSKCVYKGENYCECQMVENKMEEEMRMKKKRGGKKKKNKGKKKKANGMKKWKIKLMNKKKRLCKFQEGHFCTKKKSKCRIRAWAYKCERGKRKRFCCKGVKKDSGKADEECSPKCRDNEYCDKDTKTCVCPNPGINVCLPVYTLFDSWNLNWSAAKTRCEEHGGELAMFRNDEEVTLLKKFFEDELKVDGRDSPRYWVGVKTAVADDPDSWKFIGGGALVDVMSYGWGWSIGESNQMFFIDVDNDSNLCLAGVVLGGGVVAMYDEDCTIEKKFICQNILPE